MFIYICNIQKKQESAIHELKRKINDNGTYNENKTNWKKISSLNEAKSFISNIIKNPPKSQQENDKICIDMDTFRTLLHSIDVFQTKCKEADNTINNLQNKIIELEKKNDNDIDIDIDNNNDSCVVRISL